MKWRAFVVIVGSAALAATLAACGGSGGGGREITVNYQAIDYETIQDKFSVAVSSGSAPDVATLDMTWIPTYASKGLLADLTSLSGGDLNGKPIEGAYSKGALQAMQYENKYVTMLYDFDAYALYYRVISMD